MSSCRAANGKPGTAKALQLVALALTQADDTQATLDDGGPMEALCGQLLAWSGEQDAAL